jgi:hypothetical protein
VTTGSQLDDRRPDPGIVASSAFAVAVADPPRSTGFGSTLGASVGSVASRLMVTDSLEVPPALVAVQVSVAPSVSELMVVESHPLELLMADSLSTTVQLTVTLLVYQLLLPSVPLTRGVMAGGVVSVGVEATT